ncbi:MAG: MCE family protein [Desulfonatronovibrio sp. MSAO_Bac4]|nr:MAG: MCE family protein [Desulfonatronovibrio sp. MSAO_Bac4]
MKQKIGAEVKVGFFVFIAVILLAYMTTQITKGRVVTKEMYTVYAHFENVSGLKTNSPVEIAGIDIGVVHEIALENNLARVGMAIRPDVIIYEDAQATIRTRGVLGDKFVEINPGTPQSAKIDDQGTLARGIQPTDLDQVMARVGDIADDLRIVSRSVANVLGGPEGEAGMQETFDSLREFAVSINQLVQANTRSVEMIVANLEHFSADLADISRSNKESIRYMVQNFESASKELNVALSQMSSILSTAEHGEGPVATLLQDKQMSEDMRETVASLESISRKLDQGQGTLGKLISDDETGQKIDDALDGINEFLDRFDRFQTIVDFHTEYMFESGDTKSYLNLTLQPAEDRFYMFSLIDDPKGRTESRETVTKQRTGGGSWTTTEEIRDRTEKDKLKFSAQLAKRWNDLILRGGIIESTGGVGMDYFLWDDRIKLFAEAFDLGSDDRAHLKAGANLYFLQNFYLTAGYDDFISRNRDNRSFFGGLGFYFTDEDLKYLMSSVPVGSMD